MKFRQKSPRRLIRSQFEMIPAVDMVLSIMIFFMLTSSYVFQPGIKISLPKTTTTEAGLKRELVVFIAQDGSIFFQNQKLPMEELGERIKKELEKGFTPFLIINADKNALHGVVVQVMDIAKVAGITRFAIATEPKK